MSRQPIGAPADAPARGPRQTIFEIGSPDSRCVEPPTLDVPDIDLSEELGALRRREPPALPSVSELEIMRHYGHLSEMNFGVDTGMYPLGSCTMKYNPRINEDAARLEGFAGLHPYQPAETVQGVLELLIGLAEALAEISGLPGVTLQPAAGAHGELTALMCIRAALTDAGDPREVVLVPDTAHGTNPATVTMCDYRTVTVPSDARGGVDVAALRALLDDRVAAMMLTNPNTLGLFDENIVEINCLIHEAGAYTYCDGANLNAILGKTRPGDLGFDALHINVHKTFSTPHGGGGPGAGPVCVAERLATYLPGPVPTRRADGTVGLDRPASSIGRVRSFHGNIGVLVRAYSYIRALGGEGLTEVAEQAVLSANYLKSRLRGSAWDVPYDRPCMHELVLSGARLRRERGVRTLDVAKRLLDYGMHPPTVYFPLVVEEAFMIEPTETESKATLDRFVDVMMRIAEETVDDPGVVTGAPYTTPVRRLDEATAAKKPDVAWRPARASE